MTTLWQAVIKIDWDMPQRKPMDSAWSYIPSKEIIIKAINIAILIDVGTKNLN